ncbi:uncharacterized protein LOC9636552 [Selaginella moellendorffii]|uniref:uncharacterized protein LOC9636552 n=1 Tax=Selaginella moellendorffii TaxID=88036 RepID=UPI000D1CB88E|nr:uncharacterized protein LOC9636552 [Selaginella moellendorffii]|eukprot:XP_024533472.1 uncharacterized protein LOC9636552 [Selaginella moellendorffii]
MAKAAAAAAASTLEGLLEEAKRRAVLFVLFVLTIAYCMSLTSNSVVVNIPIAIVLLAVTRRISLELIIRWRPSSLETIPVIYQCKRLAPNDPLISSPSVPSTKWRSQIDSPAVEAALEEFTHRIVAEFVTNLWYAMITPDRECPQEIENIINGAIGEVSVRVKQVNLITLLTRDIVDVIANHLEVYRELQASIGADYLGTLSTEERDEKIKKSLASAKKLHPAVSSVEMEIQVLQRLMGGVLAIVLGPEEANCKIVRCFSRELLACAVMRQVMNLACPRIINEVIDWLVVSQRSRLSKGIKAPAEIIRADSSQFTDSGMLPTDVGVEMSEVGKIEDEESSKKVSTSTSSLTAQSMKSGTHSAHHVYPSRSGDWAHALDVFNQRKTQALAPEHLDNLWAKGRNYKRKDAKKTVPKGGGLEQSTATEEVPIIGDNDEGMSELRDIREGSSLLDKTVTVDNDYYGRPRNQSKVIVVGEDSIGVRSGASKEASVSRVIHHPLEVPEAGHEENMQKTHRHRRSHSSGGGVDQEKYSEASKKPAPGGTVGYKSKLSCKVLGAHYEKNGSKSFAVYSISVSNVEEQTWVVMRRYRNFEQLHRRLRDMPHYTLSLPPKRFLSSNLDNAFVRERCVLLNKYLKDLLSIPSIAELHEVWDFLSAKSRNYAFGDSVSIMKTLAVNVDDAVDDVFRQIKGVSGGVLGTTGTRKSSSLIERSEPSQTWNAAAVPSSYAVGDAATNSQPSDDDGEDGYGSGWHSDSEVHNVQHNRRLEASFSDGHSPVESLAGSEMIDEPEWNPPKVTVPLLNLVDIIFQLEGRGWIRRQIVWIAKQVLQLGMADAIDDWLLTQIQYLRSEDVIVCGIKRLQQLLWPDGIFLIKHPKFQLSADNQAAPQLSFEDELEAARRKMVVRELLQDQAPTALVSLIGRKQYMRCAKDIYSFLQSQVCIKQLAYSLLEKVLGAAFPELEDLILEVHGATA